MLQRYLLFWRHPDVFSLSTSRLNKYLNLHEQTASHEASGFLRPPKHLIWPQAPKRGLRFTQNYA